MKKQNIILALIISVASVTVYAATSNQQEKEAKSVAWYTANVRQARQMNKDCYENSEMQKTADCKNALHALELVYVGVGN